MSESTFCPYCNAKLRLGSSSTSRRRTTRVKCRVCRRKFHPNLVYTADGQQLPLNEPLTAGAGERDDHEAHADRRRHSHDRDPPEPIPPPSDESIDPTVKKAAFPSGHPPAGLPRTPTAAEVAGVAPAASGQASGALDLLDLGLPPALPVRFGSRT